MQSLTGIIETAYEGTTSSGKIKTDYKITGLKFTDWNGKKFQQGDTVTVTYTEKQNGTFTNRTIQSITLSQGVAPKASPVANTAPTSTYVPVDPEVKQKMIVDQNSNSNATELLSKLIEGKLCKTHEMDVDELLSMHTQIATYLSDKVISAAYHSNPKDSNFFDNIPV